MITISAFLNSGVSRSWLSRMREDSQLAFRERNNLDGIRNLNVNGRRMQSYALAIVKTDPVWLRSASLQVADLTGSERKFNVSFDERIELDACVVSRTPGGDQIEIEAVGNVLAAVF